VWLFRVAQLFGYGFQTILHFADGGVEYSVENGTKVGAGPEQPGV